MKIAFFNATQVGSTGSIVKSLAKHCRNEEHDVLCFFGMQTATWDGIPCYFTIKGGFQKYFVKAEARFGGRDGFVNNRETKKAILKLKAFGPDIIHIHNVHGEWINLELLVQFAEENDIPIVLTTHDCWIETGRCAHYSFLGCKKYLDQCGHCPFRLNYPKTYLLDRSRFYWSKKRDCLNYVSLILSPSKWLANEIQQSGIKNPISVVGNPCDEQTFAFRPKEENKGSKTLGFVSFSWTEEKGLSLAQLIAKHYLAVGYRVVFVGMSQTDPRLPKGAVGIARTNNRQEMAGLYQSFDCLVNPTKQDVYSMVNVEALARGTPVVVSKAGGAWEMLTGDWSRGIAQEYSLESFIAAIDEILQNPPQGVSPLILSLAEPKFAENTLRIYQEVLKQRH